MEEFGIPPSKFGPSAQRIIDRAVEELRRRNHELLTNEHIFLAFAQLEGDAVSETMHGLDVNPRDVLQALQDHLRVLRTFSGHDLRVAQPTKLVFKLALHQAGRVGRPTIEASDLFSAIFEERNGVPASIIRRHGIEPEALVPRVAARIRENELREERLQKRFELPPALKQLATNLNLLAREDRIAPVYGRDAEIGQVLEMSPRYQRHLHLPDKVIGWLDTAAVRAEIDRRGEVGSSDVIEVISHAARMPRDMVFRDVGDRFKEIEARLQKRVVGQEKAVQALAHRLVLNKGPLKDGFDRPDGVLMFLGPTGVGKTELAKAVAEFLFGDEKKMIRIDMSEYQHGGASVGKLIGTPRGITGSERGGVLTNQLKDNPCSVVLLDEIEKASPSVLNLFLQAFDEGWITDGRGRRVYLSDAVVIMTSNIGSEHFRKLTSPMGFRAGHVPLDHIKVDVDRELERRFPPEFRNRIDGIVLFQPLTTDDVRQIALKYISQIQDTLRRWNKTLTIGSEALERLVQEGYSLAYGARFLKRVIDDRIKLPISRQWKEVRHFHVRVQQDHVAIEAARPALVERADTEIAV